MAGRTRKQPGSDKKIRPPIVDRRDRLWFPKNDTKKRVWVTEGKLGPYLESGFTFVSKEEIERESNGMPVGQRNIEAGSMKSGNVSVNVGRADGSENVQAYLLQMDIGDYLELRKEIDEYRQEPLKEILKDIDQKKSSGMYYGGVKLNSSGV